MISRRAKAVKRLLKSSNRKKNYKPARAQIYRKRFERNMVILFPPTKNSRIRHSTLAGVKVAIVMPRKVERTILYLHGGGFVLGSLRTYQQHLIRVADMCKAKVIAIEYSLAPESPYPRALDEIQTVWEVLIKQGLNPANTVIMGDSAGGNLAMASALRYRDTKLPLPACLVLISPALDATFSGESYVAQLDKDVLLNMNKMAFFMESYVQEHPKTDPFVSPIFADLKGLPPFLIHVGSEELLLSDSVALMGNAERDGVKGTMYQGDGMWHGWHLFAAYVPEAKQAMKMIAEYILSQTTSKN